MSLPSLQRRYGVYIMVLVISRATDVAANIHVSCPLAKVTTVSYEREV